MFWIMGSGTIFVSLDAIFKSPATRFIARQLEHVKWEGFRFEDLIFPLFLFIVGTVLPFSISRRIERGQSRRALYLHIFKRATVLILLGLILNGLLRFNWPQMRWPGVLQRIGLCYFFASLLVMNTKWRTQLIVAVGILLLYWAAMTLIPVPGYGPGVITPEACLSSYIDQHLLPGKIYEECYGYGDRRLGRPLAPLRTLRQSQNNGTGTCRHSVPHSRIRLGHGLSNNQNYMDKLIRAVFRRMVFITAGIILLGHRCQRI